MKKLFLAFALIPLFSMAQVVQPDTNQLDFKNVMVGERDTLSLTLNNQLADSIRITGIKFYAIYNEIPFSVSEEIFTIPQNGSHTIEVYFEPEQNIWHNSEMVIQHNASSGFEAVDLVGQGKFPLSYYDTTENLIEEDLKDALHWKLAQGYVQKTYNEARDEMYMEIDNEKNNGQAASSNTIECVYTGTVKSGYTSRSNAQSTSPNFNTEHTFPQGFFNSVLPERSDLHHLFPTTNTSNSQRSNDPFGTVSTASATYNVGGSKSDGSTFEPRDAQKGSTARAMMYFVLRYEDYSNHFSTQENILRDWHNDFLPDSVEEKRNEDIFDFQKNRNPFVDYPQLEKRITKFVSTSSAPVQYGLDILQSAIDFGVFSGRDSFDYVLVNRGNQTIDFSNFELSDSSILSFRAFSGKDTSIVPGDAIEIRVVIDSAAGGQVREDLTFDTNIPGSQGSFTIPIRGNSIVVSIPEKSWANEIKVYPNPMKEQLFIENLNLANIEVQLLDALGRAIAVHSFTQNGRLVLSTEQLKKGIYLLELLHGEERLVKKLIK